MRRCSIVLFAVSLVLFFGAMTSGIEASGIDQVLLEGVDGGSLSGVLIENSPTGLSALSGDLRIRIAFNSQDRGVLIDTRNVVLNPLTNFGGCYLIPSQFYIYENIFSVEGLDFVGEDNILAYQINPTILSPDYDFTSNIGTGCLYIFREDLDNGQSIPVQEPRQGNKFMVVGFTGNNVADRIVWFHMIGDFSVLE